MTAEHLVGWLFESAVVGFVVLGCGAVAAKLCRQPIKRIRVIQSVLFVVVAAPLMLRTPVVPYWSFRILPGATEDVSPSLPLEIGEAGSGAIASTTEANDSRAFDGHPSASGRDDSNAFSRPWRFFLGLPLWQTGLLFLYGTAVCVLLARLGMGLAARRKVVWASVPPSANTAALLLEVGGSPARRVRLMMSDRVQSPVTWGIWRPVIVLPLRWCQEKSAVELRYSLAHEWSHIEQRDIAASYLAVAAELVCFYQPVFWWLRRKLALCQDLVADASAAEFADDPEDYAAFLVMLARQQAGEPIPAALGIFSRRSHLFWRISMLCSSDPIARRCTFGWNITAAMAVIAALAATASVRLAPVSAADQPPSTVPTSDELIRVLREKAWGADAAAIEYNATYLQNGVTAQAEFRLERRGEYRRWRIRRTDPAAVGTTEVLAQNPVYSFRVARDGDSKEWVLKRIHVSGDEPEGPSSSMLIPSKMIASEFARLSQRPFSFGINRRAVDVLPFYQLSIDVSDSGEHLRVIGQRPQVDTPDPLASDLTAVFDRRSYSVKSYDISYADGTSFAGKLTYNRGEENKNQAAFEWHETASLRNPELPPEFDSHLVVTKTFDEISHEDDVFFLTYYGIPEPNFER